MEVEQERFRERTMLAQANICTIDVNTVRLGIKRCSSFLNQPSLDQLFKQSEDDIKEETFRRCLLSLKEEQHAVLACEGREQGLAICISTAVLLSYNEEAAVCPYVCPCPQDLGSAECPARLQPASAVSMLSPKWYPCHSLPQLLLSSKDLLPSFIPFSCIHICIIEKKHFGLLPHIIKVSGGKGTAVRRPHSWSAFVGHVGGLRSKRQTAQSALCTTGAGTPEYDPPNLTSLPCTMVAPVWL